VDEALHTGTSFMNSRELLHFDAHFENILTDGRRLYFTDYGLALSSRFGLSPEYTRFFERHRTYDRCYTITYLVEWLVTAFCGYGRDDRDARDALVLACARGARPNNPRNPTRPESRCDFNGFEIPFASQSPHRACRSAHSTSNTPPVNFISCIQPAEMGRISSS
jgi:hypothetical protein